MRMQAILAGAAVVIAAPSLCAQGLDHAGVRTIDLDSDASRQVVVDREAGQYLGHPTTVLLEDGTTMIAVYPMGHGRGPIIMKRSSDGGLTWSDRLATPASWETSKETPTIHRVFDPADGTKRLIMFSGLYPIRMAVSEDDGANWSELVPIGDFGGIVAMGTVIECKNGDYVALFHDDGRFFTEGGEVSPTFTLYQIRSIDGGMTWGDPEAIWSGADIHLCEPGSIRSPDGEQIVVLLRENRRKEPSHFMVTSDEARTWSEPKPMHPALTGDRHTAKYAPDGRVVVSFRDTAADSPTAGDWMAWVGSFDDIITGGPGDYRVRLKDNKHKWDCAYPGVEVLPDGTFVCTTYGRWTEGEEPYILSVRFDVDELDRLAGGSP